MRGADVGELGFLAGLRVELRRVRRPKRADSRPRARRPATLARCAPAPARSRASAARPRRSARASPTWPPKASSRSRWAEASTSARSSCWPWISTSARPMSRISVTLEGWSLTKTRVRPSAVWTRRRMMSPSSSSAFSARMARAGWLRGTSNTAETWPCAAPWRTSEASPRAPSASDSASSRMDLPAPVSPVSTERPGEKSMSSRSIRTISRIDRLDSIQASSMISETLAFRDHADRQAPPKSLPAFDIHEPAFSRGSSPPVCSSA